MGRFKNDNGTENWTKRENSVLFFRHPFGDENFLFGDYFIHSHNLFPGKCGDIVRRKKILVTLGVKRV